MARPDVCPHCKGTGALWDRHIGTWEPCGCNEWDDALEASDDEPEDDTRDRDYDDRMSREDN